MSTPSRCTEKVKRKRKPLKLYVWEDVLTDYTSGVMFALARTEEQARAAIKKACSYIPEGDLVKKPKVVRKVEGFAVWGGG